MSQLSEMISHWVKWYLAIFQEEEKMPHVELASQGGLLGTILALVYFAHLGRCTEVTESQFNHYVLVNTVIFKKQKGKIYKWFITGTRYLETS